MNLNRIGNWAADGYEAKQKRIEQFLKQTHSYIDQLPPGDHGAVFNRTLGHFIDDFQRLYAQGMQTPADCDLWAEKMMTWGNILTHRASLLSS